MRFLQVVILLVCCFLVWGRSAGNSSFNSRRQVRQHNHKHIHRQAVVFRSLQESLQNSSLSPEERQFLEKVLDNVENSAIGKKVIAQLDGQFDFAFQFFDFPQKSTWGTYSPGVIKLNRNFLKGRCKHEKMHNLILCSSVVIHEMTHSVHRRNNIRLMPKNPSWETRLKELMLRELHCRVNQFELSAELVNLLWSDEYRQAGHRHHFMALHEAAAWNSVVEAKIAEGMDSFQAEAFARKALIEHLWRNPQKKELVPGQIFKLNTASIPPQAGTNHTVLPPENCRQKTETERGITKTPAVWFSL